MGGTEFWRILSLKVIRSDLQFRGLLWRPVWRLEAGGWEVKGAAGGMSRLLPRGREKAHSGGKINKNLVVSECV